MNLDIVKDKENIQIYPQAIPRDIKWKQIKQGTPQ